MWFRRKFEVGDRVKAKVLFSFIELYYLQRNNRVGTIVYIKKGELWRDEYWLRMDKPTKADVWERPRGVNIPKGYAYPAIFEELELLEPFKPFNVWSTEPPKVEREPQEERIPPVWENKVSTKA